MVLAAEHMYLIPVLSLHVLLAYLMCLLLSETSTEVLEYHSTSSTGLQCVKPTRFVLMYLVTLVIALVGVGEVLAVARHLAEVAYMLISSWAPYKNSVTVWDLQSHYYFDVPMQSYCMLCILFLRHFSLYIRSLLPTEEYFSCLSVYLAYISLLSLQLALLVGVYMFIKILSFLLIIQVFIRICDDVDWGSLDYDDPLYKANYYSFIIIIIEHMAPPTCLTF